MKTECLYFRISLIIKKFMFDILFLVLSLKSFSYFSMPLQFKCSCMEFEVYLGYTNLHVQNLLHLISMIYFDFAGYEWSHVTGEICRGLCVFIKILSQLQKCSDM